MIPFKERRESRQQISRQFKTTARSGALQAVFRCAAQCTMRQVVFPLEWFMQHSYRYSEVFVLALTAPPGLRFDNAPEQRPVKLGMSGLNQPNT